MAPWPLIPAVRDRRSYRGSGGTGYAAPRPRPSGKSGLGKTSITAPAGSWQTNSVSPHKSVVNQKHSGVAMIRRALPVMCLLSSPALAAGTCWNVDEFREAFPPPHGDAYLVGPAYSAFVRWAELSTPPADALWVVEHGMVGTAADVDLVFFIHGCAVGKGALPAEIWRSWLAHGRAS